MSSERGSDSLKYCILENDRLICFKTTIYTFLCVSNMGNRDALRLCVWFNPAVCASRRNILEQGIEVLTASRGIEFGTISRGTAGKIVKKELRRTLHSAACSRKWFWVTFRFICRREELAVFFSSWGEVKSLSTFYFVVQCDFRFFCTRLRGNISRNGQRMLKSAQNEVCF